MQLENGIQYLLWWSQLREILSYQHLNNLSLFHFLKQSPPHVLNSSLKKYLGQNTFDSLTNRIKKASIAASLYAFSRYTYKIIHVTCTDIIKENEAEGTVGVQDAATPFNRHQQLGRGIPPAGSEHPEGDSRATLLDAQHDQRARSDLPNGYDRGSDFQVATECNDCRRWGFCLLEDWCIQVRVCHPQTQQRPPLEVANAQEERDAWESVTLQMATQVGF